MMACFTRRDLAGYYRLNARIHAAINAAAQNPVLTGTYQRINARVQALRFRTNQNEAKWKRAVQEHDAMIDALDAHDARRACARVLVEHLNRKRDTVLELLRAGDIYPLAAKRMTVDRPKRIWPPAGTRNRAERGLRGARAPAAPQTRGRGAVRRRLARPLRDRRVDLPDHAGRRASCRRPRATSPRRSTSRAS